VSAIPGVWLRLASPTERVPTPRNVGTDWLFAETVFAEISRSAQ